MGSTHARQPYSGRQCPLLVSFSGIDGCGKTTQIESLKNYLQEAGLRVCLIRFWEEVATLRRLRESVCHALFKGERGVGLPGKPVCRRDKNVQSWYMPPLRMALSALDSLSLDLLQARIRHQHSADIVIFDRYIYDQLVNLDTNDRVFRLYCGWLLRLVRTPDAAFLLDVEPEAAYQRKPEYPIEFMHRTRARYFAIASSAGLSVISSGAVGDVASHVRQELEQHLVGLRDKPAVCAFTNTSG